jgi:hypothetical protein
MSNEALINRLNRGYVCLDDAGPAWRAAHGAGFDPSLIEDSLRETPAARLSRNDSVGPRNTRKKHRRTTGDRCPPHSANARLHLVPGLAVRQTRFRPQFSCVSLISRLIQLNRPSSANICALSTLSSACRWLRRTMIQDTETFLRFPHNHDAEFVVGTRQS